MSEAHGMDFSNALNALRMGHKVARAYWQGRHLKMEGDDPLVIVLYDAEGSVLWGADNADLTANDWELVD